MQLKIKITLSNLTLFSKPNQNIASNNDAGLYQSFNLKGK